MKLLRSALGWGFAAVYIAATILLLCSQGLFGESFIALILGLPWSALLAFVAARFADRYMPPLESPLFLIAVYAHVLLPIMLNALLFYVIGFGLERLVKKKEAR